VLDVTQYLTLPICSGITRSVIENSNLSNYTVLHSRRQYSAITNKIKDVLKLRQGSLVHLKF
jgi:hypothetical protein